MAPAMGSRIRLPAGRGLGTARCLRVLLRPPARRALFSMLTAAFFTAGVKAGVLADT